MGKQMKWEHWAWSRRDKGSDSPVVSEHGCSAEAQLWLWRIKAIPGHLYFSKIPRLFWYTSCLQVFTGDCRLFSEKAMAPHSSTLAWKIPWMEEPGGLQSMGSLIVGHNWATSLWLFTFMHWRRKWQPTPVFLPGESQGQESLMDWRLRGHTESDTTEVT